MVHRFSTRLFPVLTPALLALAFTTLAPVSPVRANTGMAAPDFVPALVRGDIAVDPGFTADAPLQARLDRAVSDLGLSHMVANGRLGLALVDLNQPGGPRLAEVNGRQMMYAASVPKIAVLYAAFEARREGRLSIDTGFRSVLTSMIRVSSNLAASAAIQKVGFDYIASVLWASKLYDPASGGGLWVGKAYGGQNDSWHRDPIANISHGATPHALASLFTLLAQGRLVDEDASREMKAILGDPGIHHKFVRGLEETHPGSRIFRKSGTWHEWHGDAALVERDDKRYVAIALCEDANGGELLKRLIVALDDCVPTRPATTARLGS